MKTNIIASLAIAASLLMSGCAHRAPVQSVVTPTAATASTVRITNVSVCRFTATNGKGYSSLPAVTLVTFSDGDQWVKMPNGNRFRVYDTDTLKDPEHTPAFYIKARTNSGALLVGSAHHCN